MKKIGLLIGGAFLLAACDASPGGNHDILPVVHDEAVEQVENHEGHEGHEMEAAQEETTDSVSTATPTTQPETIETPKDSAK